MKLENWAGIAMVALGAYVVYKISKGLSAVGDGLGAGASAVGQAVTDTATNPTTPDNNNIVNTRKPQTRTVYVDRIINVKDQFKNSYIPVGYSGTAVQVGGTANAPVFSTNVAGQPSFVRDFGNKVSIFNYKPIPDQMVTRRESKQVVVPVPKTFANSLKASVGSLIQTSKKGTSTTVHYGPTGVKQIVKKIVNVKTRIK